MKRKLRPPLRPPWTLLGCCVVVAALGAIEWYQFAAAAPAPLAPPPAAAGPAAAAELASFVPPPTERFAEIAQRPLFVPERRPQQDSEPPKPVPPPVAPALVVQGVVLLPEGRYAVIQHGNPPKLEAVAEGATVEGWRVVHIEAHRIAISAGTATLEVAVGKPGKDAPPRGAPQGPAARHGFTAAGED